MKYILFIMSLLVAQNIAWSQDLQSLIDLGMENNPDVKKFNLRYEIASEKVNEVNAIPNTEFSYGYFVSEPETRTGAQKMKFSLKQMMPWFGSITARESYVSSLSDKEFEEIVIAKRKLIASISNSYYALYALNRKDSYIEENLELLNVYETLALRSVETGNASVVSVLRIQIRKNELLDLQEVLRHNYRSEKALLNGLLDRGPSVEILILDSLPMPKTDFDIDRNELQMHPELLKYDKLYASVEQFELLNQKEKSPMIGFGLDYIPVEKRANMDFPDNGKDIFMPMVSLSIPIFNKKYKSNSRQNELKLLEIDVQKQSQYIQLNRMMDHAMHGRRAARHSYQTQLKNIEQTKNAERILIKSYESGAVDFNDVLDIQELQLRFQIGLVSAIIDYYNQTTMINYLSI